MKPFNPKIKRVLNGIINVLFYGCIFLMLLITFQIFCCSSFYIPSDSMEPDLKIGDNILVNKMTKGARLFSLRKAFEKKDFNIKRVPGFGSFNRSDILVFNFPYPVNWDSISFDIMKYYVKRCIALPGDTIEIVNGHFKIKNNTTILGNLLSQKYISTLDESSQKTIQYETYPWDKQMNWTVKEFGPLPVPAKGQIIKMDSTTYILYNKLIRWEENKTLQINGNDIYLGDSLIHSYSFSHNYYFVAGDKLENSQDSRYWGLLPEDYIVGKAVMIWNSKDPYTGKIRWNRVGKRIK